MLLALLVGAALFTAGCGETISPAPRVTPTATPPITAEPAGYNGQIPSPGVTGLPDIAGVVESIAPAVVSVIATVETRNAFGQITQESSQGSGVIFDPEGYILTNNHVVENAVEVVVTLTDRSRHRAEIIGTDPLSDLAVLKLDPRNVRELITAPLGDTDAMRIGEWVIAIGCPVGLCDTVTVGVVSAKHRQLSIGAGQPLYDLVQTDAVINPGNSGGPLLNLRGEVIGINTAIIRGTIGAGQQADGIGFAVSMSTAGPVTVQLIETGEVLRGRLGIFIDEVTPTMAEELDLAVDHGVIATQVIPDSAADEAGMRAGDIIVRVSSHDIVTVTDLQRLLLAEYRPGDTVRVTVVRDAVHLTFDVTLEA
ncbi:MAG: trypsin-like peptidase domain-containing protein [Dehalococcoidia bacterium]